MFVDGCRIEAAEAVCDSAGDLGIDVLDGLSSLVEKNLVNQRADPDGQPRFWMFETIREFALESLAGVDALNSLRTRHESFFLSFAHDIKERELTISEEVALLAREQANIHAALALANERGEVAFVAAAVGDLWRLWLHRSQLDEGLRWAEAALASRETLPNANLARLLVGASELFRFAGDYARAKSLKLECLELDRRFAITVPGAHGGPNAANLLADLADMAVDEGDIDTARAYLERSQALGGGARALASLGEIFLRGGDLERAQSCFEEALPGFIASGHSFNHAVMLEALGEVALRRSDHVNALAYFSRALREFRVLGDEGAIAECLGDLAAVAAVEGDVVRAGCLIGAARAFREPGRSAESTLDSARLGALPQGAIEAGQLLSIDEAVQYALDMDSDRGGDFAHK